MYRLVANGATKPAVQLVGGESRHAPVVTVPAG
jgi:hypothetical protein